MKWAYRRYSVDRSRICPSGLVYRPLVKLGVHGATGVAFVSALVDTGADHSIFPASIATEVGAELFDDELESAKGISGHAISVTLGRVRLELIAGEQSLAWSAIVGFAKFDSEDECSVLGHIGVLEFFSAVFDGVNQVLELAPRENFPR